ncbi:sterigmatocystin 8-O-methyltransferase [Hypoxylon sp. NC1633]|nr:sterigmatocystin 8-O-methyltransferase [Hypoxylon sp. NC1633]
MASHVLDPRIVQLARVISLSVTKIEAALVANGLPSLSFDEDAPVGYLPPEILGAQDAVLDATAELHDLLLEPMHLIKKHSGSNNSVCLQAISRYGIANLVPLGGHTSFAELAKQTGLEDQMITRLLRHAMTMRIFREPEPGQVAHTKASKLIASSHMNAWLKIGTHEMWPAATKEPNQTGFSLSRNSTQSIYDFVGSSPERGSQFAEAMAIWASRPDYAPSHAVNGYDWAALSRVFFSASDSTTQRIRVVDVGGAQGHVAVALARQFPHLEVVVQDMDKVIQGAEAGLPQDLKNDGRVRFMAHDLFAPQPISARVFFFRWILHNWADKYCIAILRAHIPVLSPGVRIIVMDTIMPDPGEGSEGVGDVPLWIEKDLRSEDLNMSAVFNARERMFREWKALFIEADARFILKSVNRPKGSTLSLMEIEWTL